MLVGGVPEYKDDQGFYVNSTILADANNSMEFVREEIFGSVLAVSTFDTEEGIELANDSIYGLDKSIWSSDLSQVHRVSHQ